MTRATVLRTVRPVVSALFACVPVIVLSQVNERPRHPMDPMKAHFWLSFRGLDGLTELPELRFYSNPALSGPVAMVLDRGGLTVNGRPVCVWPASAFDLQFPDRRFDLVAADDPNRSCPPDVPLRFSDYEGAFGVYVEITRLNEPVVEVRYRGRPYFFSLRSVTADPWRGSGGGSILRSPDASPPMLGGVDIPAAFRPQDRRDRFAVNLLVSPKSGSAVVANLSSLNAFENFSLGQGAHVATVYGRSNGWYLLRLFDGRTAWLSPDDAGKYVALERLYQRGPTGIWESWDRTLATAPGGSQRIVVGRDPRRAWIGLLEWHAKPGPLTVYPAPNKNEPPIGRSDDREDTYLESIHAGELGYRPIIFSRQPGWLEVGLADDHRSYRNESARRVWIEDDPSRWAVREVAAPEREKLLTAAWAPEALPTVEVMETRRVDGVLWLRVKVFVGEPCEFSIGDVDPIVLGEGWIRAHAPSGRPLVWYETYCD